MRLLNGFGAFAALEGGCGLKTVKLLGSFIVALFVWALLLGNSAAQTNPASVWPMAGHDPQRTGLSTFIGPTTVSATPSWTFTSGGPVIGDLVISADGTIYFASDQLYALNPDGSTFVPPISLTPLTSPAVDDLNGFVYVIARNLSGGYDVVQYSKQLQNPIVVYHGTLEFNAIVPTPLIIGLDGTIYFSDGVAVIAVGPRTWRSPGQPFSGPCFGNPGLLTPTLGRDASVYSMCQSGGGSGFGSGIYRFDSNTGAQIAFAAYSRGGTELIMDEQNRLRAGYQAFNGIIFSGSYDAWDVSLNQLTVTGTDDFTCSRSALMPDGSSTVRIVGVGAQCFNGVAATGAFSWGSSQALPAPSSVPTVDALGNVFVGTVSGVEALRGTDGEVLWSISLGDTITTQPAISTAGNVIVGSSSGKIYSLTALSSGTIQVSTNNSDATFSINGPGVTYTGSGQSFTQTNAPAGTYTIQYSAVPGFINPDSSSQTLTAGNVITFSGTYIPQPTIKLSASSLRFLTQQDVAGPIEPQQVIISSSDVPISFSAAASTNTNFNWLTVTPMSTVTPSTLTVTVNATQLQSGIYEGTITVNAPLALNSPVVIPVELIVSPPPKGTPPPQRQRGPHQLVLLEDSTTGFSVLQEGKEEIIQSDPTQITVDVTILNNWKAWYFVTIRGVRAAAQNLPSAFLLGPNGRRSFEITFRKDEAVSFTADASIAVPPQSTQDFQMLGVYGAELLWRGVTGSPLPQNVADFALQIAAEADHSGFVDLAIAARDLDFIGALEAIEEITKDPILTTQLTAFGLPIANLSILSSAQRLFRLLEFEADEFIAATKFPTDTLTLTARGQ